MENMIPFPEKKFNIICADPRGRIASAKLQRTNAEVCLLGVTPSLKAGERVISHAVHQIIEAPYDGHSKKPDETRDRIVELLGDVSRIELFARQRASGWDVWGNEVPEEEAA